MYRCSRYVAANGDDDSVRQGCGAHVRSASVVIAQDFVDADSDAQVLEQSGHFQLTQPVPSSDLTAGATVLLWHQPPPVHVSPSIEFGRKYGVRCARHSEPVGNQDCSSSVWRSANALHVPAWPEGARMPSRNRQCSVILMTRKSQSAWSGLGTVPMEAGRGCAGHLPILSSSRPARFPPSTP